MNQTTLLIVVVALGFLTLSKSILVASGKAPPPKPMSKKNRIWLWIVILFFLLCNIGAFYLALYAKGVF